MIISNRGLVYLATYHPKSREEFISLYGLSETKFDMYGKRFINAINNFIQNK